MVRMAKRNCSGLPPAGGSLEAGCPAQGVCDTVYKRGHCMTETLSIRLDAATKKRLDLLAKQTNRSRSFLAAKAIAAYVESQEWQIGEIQRAISELESGDSISHGEVSKWLSSWGKPDETKAPQ